MKLGQWVMALLFVSLAANGVLLSYGLTTFRQNAGLLHPAPMASAYRIAKLLPEPGRGKLTARLDELRPEIERELSLYREAVRGGAAQMGADQVDRDALASRIQEARRYRSRIGDLLTGAFVATIAELPLDMRRRLVERFATQD